MPLSVTQYILNGDQGQLRGWMCATKVIPANNIIRKSGCSHGDKCVNVSSSIYILL